MRRNKPIYERNLDKSVDFVLREGASLFSEKSSRNKLSITLKKITQELDKIDVPYLVAGGFAVMLHGFRRFTEDIDILVTREGLRRIHQALIGLGYTQIFKRSRGVRDPQTGVRIEFVVSGGFPGDGKPKPVAFPDPSSCGLEIAHIKVVDLPVLVELKLASGMTGGYARAHDFKDVYELVKLHKLDEAFAEKLNPYVRDKFLEILREQRNRTLRD